MWASELSLTLRKRIQSYSTTHWHPWLRYISYAEIGCIVIDAHKPHWRAWFYRTGMRCSLQWHISFALHLPCVMELIVGGIIQTGPLRRLRGGRGLFAVKHICLWIDCTCTRLKRVAILGRFGEMLFAVPGRNNNGCVSNTNHLQYNTDVFYSTENR